MSNTITKAVLVIKEAAAKEEDLKVRELLFNLADLIYTLADAKRE